MRIVSVEFITPDAADENANAYAAVEFDEPVIGDSLVGYIDRARWDAIQQADGTNNQEKFAADVARFIKVDAAELWAKDAELRRAEIDQANNGVELTEEQKAQEAAEKKARAERAAATRAANKAAAEAEAKAKAEAEAAAGAPSAPTESNETPQGA